MDYKLTDIIYRCPWCGRDFPVPVEKGFKHTCDLITGEHKEEILKNEKEG